MEYTMYMIVMLVAVLAYIEISALKKQVRALQKQLNALARATGHEVLSVWYLPEEVRTQAEQLKAAGKTVEAIKVIREATGLSLEDAKRTFDEL